MCSSTDIFCLQVVQPLFTTILRWIYEGELEDTYHEVDSRPRKFVLFSCLGFSVGRIEKPGDSRLMT